MTKHPTIDVKQMLRERADLFTRAAEMAPAVEQAAAACIASLRAGGTVWTCGNGGSAAEAQHFAAELVGRYKRERNALRAVCLCDNIATVTSVSNDYEFADVFARQLRGMARRGDVLLAFTTSGNSENVLRASAAARENGVTVVALTGQSGGRIAGACDIAIRVPDTDTPLIQEAHLAVVHVLCDLIEAAFATPGGR
ncbi:MAG TPA: SIS domain-containing protein [Candidatus Krumholzibacteria bacterium]|nr:SIS domain-containing protein [Candidatus Krumholzibacteria bacterium]